MAKHSDVVLTVYKNDWEEFVKAHKDNVFAKCAKITEYPTTDIINVSWDFVKWYTKDDYIDEILIYFNEHDYMITTLDGDNTLHQEEYVKDDDALSEFWDYAPQVKLVV